MSPPAENARSPAPVSTMTAISSSAVERVDRRDQLAASARCSSRCASRAGSASPGRLARAARRGPGALRSPTSHPPSVATWYAGWPIARPALSECEDDGDFDEQMKIFTIAHICCYRRAGPGRSARRSCWRRSPACLLLMLSSTVARISPTSRILPDLLDVVARSRGLRRELAGQRRRRHRPARPVRAVRRPGGRRPPARHRSVLLPADRLALAGAGGRTVPPLVPADLRRLPDRGGRRDRPAVPAEHPGAAASASRRRVRPGPERPLPAGGGRPVRAGPGARAWAGRAARSAGVAFALGGFMFGHLDHGNIVRSAAWLPLTLCCADLALSAPRTAAAGSGWRSGAGSVTLAGLGLAPADPADQPGGARAVRRGTRLFALVAWQRRPCCVRRLARGVGSGVARWSSRTIASVGLLGAAIQLVPTYELGGASSRGDGLTYAESAAGGRGPGRPADAAAAVRLPRRSGRPVDALPVLGIDGLHRRRRAGAGRASGCCSVRDGWSCRWRPSERPACCWRWPRMRPIDLYAWLWSLPGFSSMRAPVRYTLIFELALALLAAAGLDRLRCRTAPRGARPVALVLAGAVVIGLGGGISLRELAARRCAGGVADDRADVSDAAARPRLADCAGRS